MNVMESCGRMVNNLIGQGYAGFHISLFPIMVSLTYVLPFLFFTSSIPDTYFAQVKAQFYAQGKLP